MGDTSPDGSEPEADLRRTIEKATRLAIGAVGTAAEVGARVVAPPEPGAPDRASDDAPSTGDVVVGAVLELQRRVLDASERATDLMGKAAPITRRVGRMPILRDVTGAVERRIDELGALGAAERRAGAELASATLDTTIADAAKSDVMERSVEQVVGELLPSILESALPEVMDLLADKPDLLVPVVEALLDPILDSALPDVIQKLNQEPEVVRELVLGQSVSMAGEMAEAVRSRGVTADDLAERIARRLTLRRPRAELTSPPRALAAGTPQVPPDSDRRSGNGDAPTP
jgi:hypothetical protein